MLKVKEVETIERCAKVVESLGSHNYPTNFAAAIRALKEPTAAPPGPAASS
jgi:hypothetical protein